MSFLLALSIGLNEANSSINATNNDNFYLKKVIQLKDECKGLTGVLYKLYLFINESSYKTYKMFFPLYDQEKIFKWLQVLKHFGPETIVYWLD